MCLLRMICAASSTMSFMPTRTRGDGTWKRIWPSPAPSSPSKRGSPFQRTRIRIGGSPGLTFGTTAISISRASGSQSGTRARARASVVQRKPLPFAVWAGPKPLAIHGAMSGAPRSHTGVLAMYVPSLSAWSSGESAQRPTATSHCRQGTP